MSKQQAAPLSRTRPAVVPIIAVFFGVATAIAVVIGTSLLIRRTLPDRIWNLNPRAQTALAAHARASGALLLAVGLAAAAAAIGLLRGRRWAWILALAIFAVNGIGDLVSLLIVRDRLRGGSGVLIAGFFLFLLLRSSVRAYFAEPV
jgi:hypothetical protein